MNCQSTEDALLKDRSGQNVKALSQHVFQQQLATFLKVNCEVFNIFLSRVKWILVTLQFLQGWQKEPGTEVAELAAVWVLPFRKAEERVLTRGG